jgi:hypothetical protein
MSRSAEFEGGRTLSDEEFHAKTLSEGGASRDVKTGTVPKRGYMVGGLQDFPEAVHPVDKFSVDDVRHHARALHEKLGEVPNVHQGSWVHEGNVILDASEKVHTRSEAVKKGMDRGEKAVYDLSHNRDIYVARSRRLRD